MKLVEEKRNTNGNGRHDGDLKVFLVPMASFGGAVQTRLDRSWSDARQTYPFGRDEQFDQNALRNRAINLDRNNVLARSIIDRCVDNVVGEGIQFQAATEDEGWNSQAEELWNEWAESACDSRRLDSWDALQRLYCRHYMRDGDAAFVLRNDGALQLPEPRILATPPGMVSQTNVVGGVEFVQSDGRPVAFHFQSGKPNEFVRINARDIVYSRRTTEAGLTRGLAAFSTTARALDQIDGLIEAVICAAEMAAMLALLIKSNNPAGELGALRGTTQTASGTQKNFKLEPAMVKFLQAGEDVTQVTPNQPSQNLNEFLTTMFRRIGLEFGLPLELVTLDFSRTNYSSARASLLQAYRTFRAIQKAMIAAFKRVYRWRISKFINEDGLPARPDAWKCRAIPPGWAWVDPTKEAQSNLIGLDGGWTTLADICASQGRDFTDVLRQRQRELQALDKAGVPTSRSNMTRDPESTPSGQFPTPAGEDEETDEESED